MTVHSAPAGQDSKRPLLALILGSVFDTWVFRVVDKMDLASERLLDSSILVINLSLPFSWLTQVKLRGRKWKFSKLQSP